MSNVPSIAPEVYAAQVHNLHHDPSGHRPIGVQPAAPTRSQ